MEWYFWVIGLLIVSNIYFIRCTVIMFKEYQNLKHGVKRIISEARSLKEICEYFDKIAMYAEKGSNNVDS